MAFQGNKLNTVAYVNGWTMWVYITQDTIEEVSSPEYFGNATLMMRTGDVFYIYAKDRMYCKYLVLENGKTTLKDMGEK